MGPKYGPCRTAADTGRWISVELRLLALRRSQPLRSGSETTSSPAPNWQGALMRTLDFRPFREDSFVKTKRKLLDDCDLWCVVSLPVGVFTAAGAGVTTNLLFFTKGQPTRKVW